MIVLQPSSLLYKLERINVTHDYSTCTNKTRQDLFLKTRRPIRSPNYYHSILVEHLHVLRLRADQLPELYGYNDVNSLTLSHESTNAQSRREEEQICRLMEWSLVPFAVVTALTL